MSLWTPTEIIGSLGSWYDASASSTITLNGSNVSEWRDRSGNLRHAVQSTPSAQPAYNETLNSLNVIRFGNGSSTSLAPASVIGAGATSGSVFLVARAQLDPPTNTTFAGAPISNFGTQGNNASHWPWTDSNIYDGAFSTTRQTVGNPTPALTSARIYGIESAASLWRFYLDATQIFTTATNTFSRGTAPLIGQTSPVNHFYDGIIAEIIVFQGLPSTADRERIEGYLAWKWGLQGNLPAAHPFKNAAPTARKFSRNAFWL